LAGKPYSAKISPHPETLEELRKKHGKELEKWWLQRFGHSFDCLLNQRLDTFSTPRMLTPYEIELLRKSKQEIGEAVRNRLKAQKNNS